MKNKILKFILILSFIPYMYILLNTLFEEHILKPSIILICLVFQIIYIITVTIVKIKHKYKELKQKCEKIQNELQNDIDKEYKIIDKTDEVYKTIQENKKEIRELRNEIHIIESCNNLMVSICLPIEIFLWGINNITNHIAICMLISITIWYLCETVKKHIYQKMVYMLEDDNETKIVINNIENKLI